MKVVLIILLVVLLVAYIAAIVRTRAGKMYTFANWWDFILLMVCGIGTTISIYWYMNNATNTVTFWIALVVAVLSLGGSLFLSVKINKGNALNMILSIMAKLFVFVIVALIVIVWLAGNLIKDSGEKAVNNINSTYQEAETGDKMIDAGDKMKKASGSLAGILLLSLVAMKWKMPHPIENESTEKEENN